MWLAETALTETLIPSRGGDTAIHMLSIVTRSAYHYQLFAYLFLSPTCFLPQANILA